MCYASADTDVSALHVCCGFYSLNNQNNQDNQDKQDKQDKQEKQDKQDKQDNQDLEFKKSASILDMKGVPPQMETQIKNHKAQSTKHKLMLSIKMCLYFTIY
jgi:hypothetical protein